MKDFLNRVRRWLTDDRRQALHAALGTIATLGVTIGWVTDDQSAALLGLSGSILALLQGALGLLLLRRSEAFQWLGTTFRGLVYGLAAAAGAAGIAFDLFTDAGVTQALAIISVGLTVVSSFVGVVNVQTVPADAAGAPLTRREYRALLADEA